MKKKDTGKKHSKRKLILFCLSLALTLTVRWLRKAGMIGI